MSSIYLHIPYCSKKCSYCNFYFSTNKEDKKLLIDAMIKEIDMKKKYLNNCIIESIYFGGGTPSILNQYDLSKILEKLYKTFNMHKNLEISFESNPEDLDIKKLKIIKKMSVTRLSIGIQSFNQKELDFMNRNHTVEESIKSIKLSQDIGFDNISIDLIYGLPNQILKTWEKNLQIALNLNLQHISSYGLTIERKTKIYHLINSKKIKELDELSFKKYFEILMKETQKNNFIQYEISNFGKRKYFSRHNIGYWTGKKYLGIGPSAHSYNTKSRQWNISNNKIYIQNINNNRKYFTKENLTTKNKYNEYICTSLRTMWGLNLQLVNKQYGEENMSYLMKKYPKWIKTNHLTKNKNHLLLTNKGKMISNSIFADFFVV